MPASHHKVTVFEYASYPDLSTYYSKIDKFSVLDDIVLQGNRYGDARDLLEPANKKFIAEVAVSRMLTNFPSFSVPGGRVNCEDDIEDVIEMLLTTLHTVQTIKFDAANLYVNGGAFNTWLVKKHSLFMLSTNKKHCTGSY